MQTFRFLHVADLHLDSPFKGLTHLPEFVRHRLINSTFDAYQKVIDCAIHEHVDFVLFAGDVYDAKDRSLRAQLRFKQGIDRLAEHGIHSYIIHGNHDPLNGRKASMNWPREAHFFPAEQVAGIDAMSRDGQKLATIFGISYANPAVQDNLALRFYKDVLPHSDGFKIGLLHTNVAGQQGHDNYAPCTLEQLVSAGMNYWALGHVHSRQVLNHDPYVVYSGNIQGRSMRERGSKGCYLVDVQDHGQVNLRFIETDAVRWIADACSIEDLHSWSELKQRIESRMLQLEEEHPECSLMLRFTIHGRGKFHNEIRHEAAASEFLEELRSQLADRIEDSGFQENGRFVWIERLDWQTASEMDRAEWIKEEHFVGDLLRLSQTISTDAKKLQEFAGEALKPLWQYEAASKWLEQLNDEERKAWLREAEQLALDVLIDEMERVT